MKKVIFLLAVNQLLLHSFVSGQSRVSSPGYAYLERLYDASVLFDTAGIPKENAGVVPRASDGGGWEKWHTVENYFYGKDRGTLPMIADLQALHPYFRDRIVELIRTCKAAGIELAVVESYRTAAKQAQYYAMGRKYTSRRGGKSRHQYGLAVDVVPIVNSVAVWNNYRLWRRIGLAGERLGLRWGGRWRVTYDPGHFEWIGGLTQHELEAGNWPEIPSARASEYQSIHEDLAKLEESWQAWSVEQSDIANNRAAEPDEESAGVGN